MAAAVGASRGPVYAEETTTSSSSKKVSQSSSVDLHCAFEPINSVTDAFIFSQPQLPIYSSPAEPVTLAEVRGPLEEQVGSARRYVVDSTRHASDALRGQISKWIGVEQAVESKVSSLIPADEPLTPGLLYVGVATLAGSVFTRYRSFPIRILTPPLLFVGSLNYFLPKTTHNLADYYLEVEQRRLPPQVRDARVWTNEKWHALVGETRQGLESAKRQTSSIVDQSLSRVEQNTGLKVGGGGGGAAAAATPSSDAKKLV